MEQVTAEGITQPEAIGRRALELIGNTLESHTAGVIDFIAAYTTIKALVSMALPFCDRATAAVLREVELRWNDGLNERQQPPAPMVVINHATAGMFS